MKILFLCTGNSCRSQMAEYLARDASSGACSQLQVESAGVDPSKVDERAIEVMEELGIDMSRASSKSIEGDRLGDFDLVITLCGDARDNCPVVGDETRVEYWPLPDPAKAEGSRQEQLEFFRTVRDDLHRRVHELIEDTKNSW